MLSVARSIERSRAEVAPEQELTHHRLPRLRGFVRQQRRVRGGASSIADRTCETPGREGRARRRTPAPSQCRASGSRRARTGHAWRTLGNSQREIEAGGRGCALRTGGLAKAIGVTNGDGWRTEAVIRVIPVVHGGGVANWRAVARGDVARRATSARDRSMERATDSILLSAHHVVGASGQERAERHRRTPPPPISTQPSTHRKPPTDPSWLTPRTPIIKRD